jgi:hypothetical protein
VSIPSKALQWGNPDRDDRNVSLMFFKPGRASILASGVRF